MATLTSDTSQRVHPPIDWHAAAWAGVIAGVMFMFMEMALVRLLHGAIPWEPRRMIAAIVLGEYVLPPPVPFSYAMMTLTMLIHFMLSVVYGLIGAAIVNRFGYKAAMLGGAVFGFAIYAVNFYVVAPAIFPWFMGARNWISLCDHIVFGAVIGAGYLWLRNRRKYARAGLFD
jgi:hypothetical protein